MKKLSVVGVALAASVLCATSLHWSPDTTSVLSIDRADARIGRPPTPVSVAGVNRRHRRAYRRSYFYGSYAHQLY